MAVKKFLQLLFCAVKAGVPIGEGLFLVEMGEPLLDDVSLEVEESFTRDSITFSVVEGGSGFNNSS